MKLHSGHTTTNTSANTYTIVSISIDGVVTGLNDTYTATNVGYSDQTGVDQQIDLTSAAGHTVSEWVDQLSMTQ